MRNGFVSVVVMLIPSLDRTVFSSSSLPGLLGTCKSNLVTQPDR